MKNDKAVVVKRSWNVSWKCSENRDAPPGKLATSQANACGIRLIQKVSAKVKRNFRAGGTGTVPATSTGSPGINAVEVRIQPHGFQLLFSDLRSVH